MNNIKTFIEEFCEEQELDYREDYSGRGMFGSRCVGIVCDNPLSTLSAFFAYIIDSDDNIGGCEVQDALGNPEEDSMGMRNILYFPKLRMEYRFYLQI